MKIKKILIELSAEKKINKKHGIYRKEIEDAFFEGNPVYFKTRDGRYFSITFKERYITIIFLYDNGIARIVTAYPSSEWQVKLYRRKRK